FQARQFYATNGPAASVSLADVNGDGKVDIVASTTTGNLSILLGNGDGTFQTKRDYGAGANSYAVTTADLNGDG
ncbi:FG-GAP-like repeat-containing protein, partial [Klebsiella michiganensis]